MFKVMFVLCLSRTVYGESPERTLISELNNFFNFDHNIFLLESSFDKKHFICSSGEDGLIPQTVYVFKNVKDIGNTTEIVTLKRIWSKNTFVAVALDDSSFERNIEFFMQFKTIQRLQFNMKIGIFFSQIASVNDLRNLFEWCRDNLIFHVFAASYRNHEATEGPIASNSLNIFTFHSFGTFDVIDVSQNNNLDSYFPSLQSNFQQHPIRVGRPRTSTFFDKIEFWSIVLGLMNASLVAVDMDVSYNTNFNELVTNEIDVLLRLFPQVSDEDISTYPMFITTWSIIVPHALPYEDFSTYLGIFASGRFFALSIITIVTVIFVLNVCRYIAQSKLLIVQTAVDVFNLLVNDNGCLRYQRMSSAELFIIGPLTFVGFVVVNGILSIMQSYFLEPVLQPQIRTLEDIHASPFPILTYNEFNRGDIISSCERRTRHTDWNDKVHLVGWGEYFKQVDTFNQSISFYEDHESIDLRFRLQKLLDIKAYHNPKIEITNLFLSYKIMVEKFPYLDRFNDITHWMKSAGLLDFWWRKEFDDKANQILKRNREQQVEKQEQKIEFPTFITYGWLASIILFVIELAWKKFEISRMKKLLPKKFCGIFLR